MPIYPAGRVCEMAECYKDAETHLVPADDLSLHVDPPAHGSGLGSGPLTCRDSQVTSYWLTSRDPARVTIKTHTSRRPGEAAKRYIYMESGYQVVEGVAYL